MVAVFVGDHLLLRNFGPYKIIFMNVCAVVVFLRILGLRRYNVWIVSVNVLNFIVILTGNLTAIKLLSCLLIISHTFETR
jgi:hypothetical protein